MAKSQIHVAEGTPKITPGTEEFEQEWFDLLPIEKKLIGYSLALGITLLTVFILIFRVFPQM